MRRHLAHNLQYLESKPQRQSGLQRTLKTLWHKETLEVIFLCATIGSAAWLVTHHAYLQVTDFAITGLDTYTTAKASDTLHTYLSKSHFGVPHASYLGFSPDEVAAEIKNSVALDNITVTKTFPHTVQIHAAETQMKIRIQAPNGTAYASIDGLLVRWYPKDAAEVPPDMQTPGMVLDTPLEPKGILQPILNTDVTKTVVTILSTAPRLGGSKLLSIGYDPIDPDRFTLAYEQGTQVVIDGRADLPVQMQKALAAVLKTGPGKKIDVRFADKVFVSAADSMH